jgi:four helix bundle protein
MAPAELLQRTRAFALAVTRFVRTLPKTDEAQEAASQLRRAANATRSNYRSARKGRSRAEFIAKLGVAREEADECVDWLEYLRDAGIAEDAALLAESNELAAILTASMKTASRNWHRTKELPRS